MYKMPEYKNGKIYKIWSPSHDDLQYIGSTTQELCMRMCAHRKDYKKYLKGKYHFVTSFDILKFDDCRIDLLEYFPCNSKVELCKKEGEMIKNNVCVNKIIPGRTINEWRQDNKEKIKEGLKNYRNQNKEKIKEVLKNYRNQNKEKIKEGHKNYRNQNKELIREKAKVKMTCECGIILRKHNKVRHYKSLKHIKYMESINV
jgi:uncharacterized protein (DUF433 family)